MYFCHNFTPFRNILGEYVEYLSDTVNKEYGFVPEKQLSPFRRLKKGSRESGGGGSGVSKKMMVAIEAAEAEIRAQQKVISVLFKNCVSHLLIKCIRNYC
jgi:hypothetical protein